MQVELGAGALSWAKFEAADKGGGFVRPQAAHVADAYSVTNILFSSGTTVRALLNRSSEALVSNP